MAENGEIAVGRFRLRGRPFGMAQNPSRTAHTQRSGQQATGKSKRTTDQGDVEDFRRRLQYGDNHRRERAKTIRLRPRNKAAGRSRSGHQADSKSRDGKDQLSEQWAVGSG